MIRSQWGSAKITVIATPGHTDGSISYLVEVDNRRILFSGDVIYDKGQVWDVYSLQKGFQRGNRQIEDYHGFLGARYDLLESLNRIKSVQPELLVPSHGRIIADPPVAIDLLIERLEECYANYVSISALRHYFPELFEEYANRPDQMRICPGKSLPTCLRHFNTTWIVISKDKAAFVIDCGSPQALKQIKNLVEKGEVTTVEGLWVTHYHADHVDSIPEFQDTFDCPCYADKRLAQVITNPIAWRLPCISPIVARIDNSTTDGQSWQWRELKMTAYYFPGQTLYHGALLVEKDELKMLFVGDSFTPAGVDDYCAQNRNWLGHGVGYDRCLKLIERLKPTHIINCHVDDAFEFSPELCLKMHRTLDRREIILAKLLPWDHPNYGTDESWIRCFPYEQKVVARADVRFNVVFTNHSSRANKAACRPIFPRDWKANPVDWIGKTIPPKSEDGPTISFTIPANVKLGRYIIPIDIRYADRKLPQFVEAVIVVRDPYDANDPYPTQTRLLRESMLDFRPCMDSIEFALERIKTFGLWHADDLQQSMTGFARSSEQALSERDGGRNR